MSDYRNRTLNPEGETPLVVRTHSSPRTNLSRRSPSRRNNLQGTPSSTEGTSLEREVPNRELSIRTGQVRRTPATEITSNRGSSPERKLSPERTFSSRGSSERTLSSRRSSERKLSPEKTSLTTSSFRRFSPERKTKFKYTSTRCFTTSS
jgi:hypothetical protein